MEYNNDSITRAIPSGLDGFKEVQRKVLFGALARSVVKLKKVSQLQSIVQEAADYHHGEVSMFKAIVQMAQTFVGKNNINLLFPSGQFGTRLQGGKDAASPRYIFTKLQSIVRKIFPILDDHVLDYVQSEGKTKEPVHYAPIIPMALVNGVDGIATGWSTSLPMYNPKKLVEYLLHRLRNEDVCVSLEPWYKGFTGTIEEHESGYLSKGVYEFGKNNKVRIMELPIGTWTDIYIQKMKMKKKKKTDNLVVRARNNSSDIHVDIVFTLSEEDYTMYSANRQLFEKDFELTSILYMTNIHLLNESNQIKKFQNVEQIMNEFIEFRYKMYEKRKAWQIQNYEKCLRETHHKVQFVLGVVDESIPIRRVTKETTVAAMTAKQIPEEYHDALLSMAISSLHMKRVEALEKHLAKLQRELAELKTTKVEAIWIRELEQLQTELGPNKRKI